MIDPKEKTAIQKAGKIFSLLVVLGGLLIGASRQFGGTGRTKIRETQIVMKGAAWALQDFRKECGRYPTPAEGFGVLLDPQPVCPAAQGPNLQRLPSDSWGASHRILSGLWFSRV